MFLKKNSVKNLKFKVTQIKTKLFLHVRIRNLFDSAIHDGTSNFKRVENFKFL